jgi:hypothetical protein
VKKSKNVFCIVPSIAIALFCPGDLLAPMVNIPAGTVLELRMGSGLESGNSRVNQTILLIRIQSSSIRTLGGSLGVATANSILVVSFARDRMAEGVPGIQAALEAGFTRFRPVLMTALAMIMGMIPMALGMGEGGEQNAPLGRAVIGGLMFATVATLFFVPVFFSLLHHRREVPHEH